MLLLIIRHKIRLKIKFICKKEFLAIDDCLDISKLIFCELFETPVSEWKEVLVRCQSTKLHNKNEDT